ncbi:MAG: o-succinylbenzoate synthase [Micrococcaceae bacterium]
MNSIPVSDVLHNMHIVSLPMITKFRNITVRELALWEGPSGWAEFAAFTEYDDSNTLPWLQAALEASHGPNISPKQSFIPINGTIPAVMPDDVEKIIKKFPGVTTFKIKVAQKGQTLSDDIARIKAVRRLIPDATLRIDANAAWTFTEAKEALQTFKEFELQYAEQPVRNLIDLKHLSELDIIPIAADEAIRLAEDSLEVIKKDAADVLVLKAAPLGGVIKVKQIASKTDKPIVISSALESSVGMHRGLLAADYATTNWACGLGTVSLFKHDICDDPLIPINGKLDTEVRTPSFKLLEKYRVTSDNEKWWQDRVARLLAIHNETITEHGTI